MLVPALLPFSYSDCFSAFYVYQGWTQCLQFSPAGDLLIQK